MATIDKKFSRQTGNPWTDANGYPVEKKRIKPREILEEAVVTTLLNKAISAHNTLYQLKEAVEKEATKCFKAFLEENNEEFEGMRTYSFNNFDHTGKVVFEVDQIVNYDENKMQLAYDTLIEFLAESADKEPEGKSMQGFLQKLITDVFKNRKGRFDSKKVNSLLLQRDEVFVKKNKTFQKAIDHIVSAKQVTGSKSYPKFFCKIGDKLEIVQLQFSAIKIEEPGKEDIPDAKEKGK